MPTSISGSAAYCTIDQMLEAYDHRSIGQLLGDDKVALNESEVRASTRLTRILKRASGMVEAACLVGEKYTAASLGALTGNSAEHLAGLVADLAMGMLWRRRPHLDKAVPPQFTEALDTLAKLRLGERIFAIDENAEAGLPAIDVQSAAEIEAEDRASYQASRWLGRRSNRNRD